METKIKLFGRCSSDAEMIIYINQAIVFEGKAEPVLSNANYDEYLLGEFDVDPSKEHNTHVEVFCTKGQVFVGTVDTNYCQDINPELTFVERKHVWQSRKYNKKISPLVPAPYIYYPNDGGEFADHTLLEKHDRYDERTNIVINGHTIDLSGKPEYPGCESWRGWFYKLDERGRVKFDVNVFLPIDYINFIINHQMTKEDFDEILLTTR